MMKIRHMDLPKEEYQEGAKRRIPLGRWLVENLPRGYDLELPDRHEPDRTSPFEDSDVDESDDRGAES
jgi:hypothetical protein